MPEMTGFRSANVETYKGARRATNYIIFARV